MQVHPLQAVHTFDQLDQNVFIYPTDTCYGLGCSIANQAAVEKIYTIKQRDTAKPVNIMVDSLDMFRRYGQTTPVVEKMIKQYLPGQLTIVVPKTEQVPVWLNPGMQDIGIRIPDHPFCLELVRLLQAPVITTSANIAGNGNLYNLEEIIQEFEGQPIAPDIIFDGGTLPKTPPSTIVRVVGESWEILRQGSLQLKL